VGVHVRKYASEKQKPISDKRAPEQRAQTYIYHSPSLRFAPTPAVHVPVADERFPVSGMILAYMMYSFHTFDP